MIGDSDTDYQFSKNINCDFIYINKKNSEKWNYDIKKMCYNFKSIEHLYQEI